MCACDTCNQSRVCAIGPLMLGDNICPYKDTDKAIKKRNKDKENKQSYAAEFL